MTPSKTILVVDDIWGRADDPMIPARYGQIEGYRFELEDACVGNKKYCADKVIERISYQYIHAVLLDMDFGGQEAYGETILEKIRNFYPTLPVIIFSATEDQQLLTRCISKGAVGSIPKAPSAQSMKKYLDDFFGGQR